MASEAKRSEPSRDIRRWHGAAIGRSNTVACQGLVWTVANARPGIVGIEAQTRDALQVLETHLRQAGSSKAGLLSVHVLLADLGDKETFDRHWIAWIGPDPSTWPQRACYGAPLSGGLLVELVVTATEVAAG